MSKNRRIKSSSGSKKAPAKKSPAKKRPKASSEGRSREIVGIVGLGSAIFIIGALLSLQIGGGRWMGPFGRSVAKAVYACAGICSYLLAAGLAVAAVRLLMNRDQVVRRHEAAGAGMGLLSLGVLFHLVGSSYRVAGYGPGGGVGESVAEVMRAVISTAGTALFALIGLLLAVVFLTPLRMSQVLAWAGLGAKFCGRQIKSAGLAVGQFCGEVIRAVLPERDQDEYYDESKDADAEEWDAYQVDPAMDGVLVDPPIIDQRSGAIEMIMDSGDTERINGVDVAAKLAIAKAESAGGVEVTDEDVLEEENVSDAATVKVDTLDKPGNKSKKAKKSKKPTKAKKVEAVVDEDEDEDEAEEVEAVEVKKPTKAKSKGKKKAAAAAREEAPTEPIIVESRFNHLDPEELKKREEQVESERLDFIPLQEGEYQLPPLNLLDYDESAEDSIDRTAMLELSARLVKTLEHFSVKGEVVAIRPGPVVTMYEFAPAPGTRINKIVNLCDDLALSLEALRVRIVAPIPGKAAVGIEVPNKTREMVYLKEILACDDFQSEKQKMPIAVGKDIEGAPVVYDLAKMPHLLVAGCTGSGKSVSVNTMIASVLYSRTPEEVRMIMVDPKMLELSIYEGIPHLLLPVVTDPKKANLALRWAVDEMERRYGLLASMGVRDISTYNKRLKKQHAQFEVDKLRRAADAAELAAEEDDEEVEVTEERQIGLPELQAPPKALPYIVVVVDEFADLMLCAPKEIETSVARIAQKARAAGIHLILATQRPSVDVITGTIKANFPSRAAFHVTSKVDSRTILDQAGAERLLGAGDMLFSDRGSSPRRVHGCYIDEDEIARVVDHLKTMGKPVYNMDIIAPREEEAPAMEDDEPADPMYDRAISLVLETRNVSISMIQRRLRVGYNRAARMVEYMEREGVVSGPDGTNRREVLAPAASEMATG